MQGTATMSELAYVNGSFMPLAEARVGVEDRGVLFADSVYEVVLIASRKLVDLDRHMARLQRSVAELSFSPVETARVEWILYRLVEESAVEDGMAYVQVSRGEAARILAPPQDLTPSILAYVRPLVLAGDVSAVRPLSVATRHDFRWGRCDIKTTALVAAIFARVEARRDGHDDVWFVDEDLSVTEATAANAWIVVQGDLLTREPGPKVLAGVTRDRVSALARNLGLAVVERPFTLEEVRAASEAFMTSATALITPIRAIDDFGLSAPGPVTTRLYQAYVRFARAPDGGLTHSSRPAAG